MSSINSILEQAASEQDAIPAQSECRSVILKVTNVRAIAALSECQGERVRVHIAGRKMPVPGTVKDLTLVTNWGLELDLRDQQVVAVDLKNHNTGRWEAAYDLAA